MDEARAKQLAASVARVAISIDGCDADTHDLVRGRPGSFERAIQALRVLATVKQARLAASEPCCLFGIDYTVTRTGLGDFERFVSEMSLQFPNLDFIRFGAVVPVGLAQEERFVERELLTYEELDSLAALQTKLAEQAPRAVEVVVDDARRFLPGASLGGVHAPVAHIEPDGQMRAFTNYEAKVGNVLQEPFDLLQRRALEWRADPFVCDSLADVHTFEDWAAVTRLLDRRYASEEDRSRLARRAG